MRVDILLCDRRTYFTLDEVGHACPLRIYGDRGGEVCALDVGGIVLAIVKLEATEKRVNR